MRIVVSIPIHENPEVVLDQVRNINRYIEGVSIVLHSSESFCEEFQNYYLLNKQKFVNTYINPEHYRVSWGDGVLMDVHISNFKYISSIVDFDYFILHSSNDMYIRSGIDNYLARFDAGYQLHFIRTDSRWWPGNKAIRDGQLYYAMNDAGVSDIVASQVEGSFYRKEIFEKMISIIDKSAFLRDRGLEYTREELMFPTIASAFVDDNKRGFPITFSEVHIFDRKSWKVQHLVWGVFHRSGLYKLVPRYIYNDFEHKLTQRILNKGDWRITPSVVKKLLKNNKRYIKRNLYLNDDRSKYQLYDGNFYAVKRVKRDMNDNLRKYIGALPKE